jgi:hypothetical protein
VAKDRRRGERDNAAAVPLADGGTQHRAAESTQRNNGNNHDLREKAVLFLENMV